MSTTLGSANKANLLNEDNEALYDPCPWFSLNAFCEIPFLEWSDAELNAEVWGEGKGARTTAGKTSLELPSGSFFDDPSPPKLPPVISNYVYFWKRPKEVFRDISLTLYDPLNIEFELQVPGSIAPKCDFFKSFSEQLPILQLYALKYGFPVEQETPNFVANTQGEVWRPWHHIYALCKAGKGQVHKPFYYEYGKYVVRLFYMGAWRRFVVDDTIPCDVEGNCLLPLTQYEGELWPIILIKALLKILSLTQTKDFFVTDFSFLSALTGWRHGRFTAVNKTSEQIWRRLLALSPRYEIPEKELEVEGKTVISSIKNPVRKDSSKKEPERIVVKGETQKFCFLFADLKEISFGENSLHSCTVAITMIRDCPLIRATKREGTKAWKRIRWVFWAKEKGIWVDENLLPPYRRLQVITSFREVSELLAPDPKLEAIMYNIPIGSDEDVEDDDDDDDDDDEIMEQLKGSAEPKLYEPEQWCDYLEFLKYLSYINVFLKPSCFNFNFKVTCLKDKSLESAPTGKTASKVPPLPQTSFVYPPVLKNTCNEPILLLCESLAGIFLCISLWVYPQKPKTSIGYLKVDQPKILKIGHASLVVERFDWRSPEQGEIIGLIKTVGYSVIGLNLKPGRHILKLWLHSDSPYVIDINSNVNVFIQKSPRIRSLMGSESQQILNYIANVSNAFMVLTQKFGKPDLPSALRDFYDIIKPGHDSIIGYLQKLDDFIETFINCILLSLKDLIPSVDELIIMMGALRSLFINPNIQCELSSGPSSASIYGGSKKPVKKIVPIVKERMLSEILNYVWIPEEIEKIVTIQRVFRGYRVRLLWKYQTPVRKEFKPYTERLKKICDALFVPSKRELEVARLLRKIIMNKPDLLTSFRFYEDFANVIQVEEFTGKIPNVEPSAWVPIARFIIACHCEEFVPCAFYLSCNLEQFVIQGFDNDTGEEIFRTTNTVSPHYYRSNAKGYTIFIFGWNEANSKTVNWKLEMVKMKYFQVIHLCNALMSSACLPYTMPSFEVFEVKNFYIPNVKSRICRCLIKIQKRTLVSLRFSASYPHVQFAVKIMLDKRFCETDAKIEGLGKVVAEVTSTNGTVIMPSLILEFIENIWWGESYSETNSTIYIIETMVLDNSWPLTKQEWGLVEPFRLNGENWKENLNSLQNKKGGSESRKKLARSSKKSMIDHKIVEGPTWFLQVLSDSTGAEPGEQIVVEEDKSYAESLKAMKISWEEKDPGRRQRGKELRMNFLYAIYLEERKQQIYCGEDYGEATFTENGKCDEFYDNPQILLERLSSLSYLISDTSSTRYIYSPRVMPTMPLCELLYKHKKVLKSISANSLPLQLLLTTDTQSSHSLYLQAEEYSRMNINVSDEVEENKRDFLRQSLYYHFVMLNHMNEEQKLSNQLMEEAYLSRLKAIERMMR